MKTRAKTKIELPKDINVTNLLNQYNHIYGQLSALKHIIYSSISLLDPESIVATVSHQIRECLAERRNTAWFKDKQGRFVKTAHDGKLLPPGERVAIEADSPDLPEGILTGRMAVWDPGSPDSPFVSGFGAPSFFPFKYSDTVTGFLVVDHVPSEERDVYQFVAHFSGIILNISLLHQEVERQKKDLEEMTGLLMTQNEQMSSLHHVGIKIAIAQDPAAICKLITDTIVQELEAKNAAAFLLDEQKNELYCVSEAGDLKPVDKISIRPDSQAPLQQSLSSGRILTRRDHPVVLDIGDNRLENWSVYPLKCKDRSIGAVVAETGELEISDQAAILINHASIVIETLMVLDKVSEERQQLANTLSSIGDGVITTDLQGRITLMNKVAENLTGSRFRKTEGKYLNEIFCLIDEQTREPVQDTLQAALQADLRSEPVYQMLMVSRDGTERPVVKSGAPIKDSQGRNVGAVVIFKDITDFRSLEKKFLRVQKLESLGVMAGGLAHDFNNLLTIILGNINLAQMGLKADDPAASPLEQAEQSIHKARDLTQKFITFSSGGDPFKRKIDIIHLLKDVAELALSGSNVKCEFNFSDEIWSVDADNEQMSQVLYNILENAKHAMPHGGVIRIRAENCRADEAHTEKDLQIPKGKYVMISVTDSGVGIEEENLHKIFDPYFSTKDRGIEKGMGLGLSIAHSVIRKHRGDIRVESSPGKGTSMHIYLPASVQQAYEARLPGPDDSVRTKNRVLFMDDEKFLRDLAMQTLKALGFEASTAENGEEAIALYAKAMDQGEPFGAVILDLMVPGGMGGKETIGKLRKIDPDVRAIVSSGYAGDPIMASYQDFGFKGALPKPYTLADLKGALKALMKR
ncbi:MAG: ATP-binding protein [Pseudomonadota bacterium]